MLCTLLLRTLFSITGDTAMPSRLRAYKSHGGHSFSVLVKDLQYSRMENSQRIQQISGILTGVTPVPYDGCEICRQVLSFPACLPCGHIFCSQCITTWLIENETCPKDRSVVLPLPGEDSSETDGWVASTTISFDDLEPSNEAERVLYGPPLGPEGREPFVELAWEDCGFDDMGNNHIPVGFNTFGQYVSVLDISLAAANAKDFLVNRPLKQEDYTGTIDSEELLPYVVAMGNLLPMYHRLVSEQDKEALTDPAAYAKYGNLVEVLCEVVRTNGGLEMEGQIPRVLWSVVHGLGHDIEENMTGEGVVGDVSQRLFFQLCYAVGAMMLIT